MKKKPPVELLLFAAMLIWGVNFAVVKAALGQFQPHVFNALRFIIASIILIIFALRRLPTLRLPWRDVALLFGLGLIHTALYQILFIEGIDLTSSSNAAVELAATPATVALISYFLGREKHSAKTWGGIVVAFLGLYFVIALGENRVTMDSPSLVGDLLVIAAMLLWAGYTALAKPVIERFSNLTFTAWSIALGTVPLLLWAVPEMVTQDWSVTTLAGWSGVVYSGVFAIAVSYIIWNHAVVRVGPTRTAIFSNFIPVIAVMTGVFFLGETMSALQITGVAMVLAGVAFARADTRR